MWPLSTAERPKQFVPLFDGKTLFEMTLARMLGIRGAVSPVVVTGATHVPLVHDALSAAGMDSARVLVEPTGRNTAPAALAAALVADSEDILVIVPSDHLISDIPAFRRAVTVAASHAAAGAIVTFGVKPTRPETGYGYIEIGESRGEGAHAVRRFTEKPDVDEAERMASDERYAWNSGMFVARAAHLLAEAEKHCPYVLAGVMEAVPATEPETSGIEIVELNEVFGRVESISIDYAIMERTENALVVPIDIGWDDVGSYRSLVSALDHDGEGNHIEGNVTVSDVSGSFIKAMSRSVTVAGLRDVVVVETAEEVLVMPLELSQSVRELSEADRD